MKKVLFDEGSKEFLLSAFGCSVNEDGIIINNKLNETVLTREGNEMTVSDFGALKKGSLRFLEADLGSLLEVVEEI